MKWNCNFSRLHKIENFQIGKICKKRFLLQKRYKEWWNVEHYYRLKQWKGVYYIFQVLSFRLAISPLIFLKIMRSIIVHLRYFWHHIYLDNFIGLKQTKNAYPLEYRKSENRIFLSLWRPPGGNFVPNKNFVS